MEQALSMVSKCKFQSLLSLPFLPEPGLSSISFFRFVGLLYQQCYADVCRRSEDAFQQRKKAKGGTDSTDDHEAHAADKWAERDSSFKWTLVQLPFKIFKPVLQT
jgi:hypothetical protein